MSVKSAVKAPFKGASAAVRGSRRVLKGKPQLTSLQRMDTNNEAYRERLRRGTRSRGGK